MAFKNLNEAKNCAISAPVLSTEDQGKTSAPTKKFSLEDEDVSVFSPTQAFSPPENHSSAADPMELCSPNSNPNVSTSMAIQMLNVQLNKVSSVAVVLYAQRIAAWEEDFSPGKFADPWLLFFLDKSQRKQSRDKHGFPARCPLHAGHPFARWPTCYLPLGKIGGMWLWRNLRTLSALTWSRVLGLCKCTRSKQPGSSARLRQLKTACANPAIFVPHRKWGKKP